MPSRGLPKGAESKMWRKRWFVGPPTGLPKSTQNLLKSQKFEGTSVCRRRHAFFMPKVSPSGGWICSNHTKYNGFGSISYFGNLVFFCFLGSFWASFLLILGFLGRHFGSQKVDANFGRKTGMELNPGIPRNPGKSRDGGSGCGPGSVQ